MKQAFDILRFIEKVKTSDIVTTTVPLGYTPGFPVVRVENDNTFLIVPFLKYKITGVVDKTEIYPIRYVLTYKLNNLPSNKLPEKLLLQTLYEGKLIKYEDLYYNKEFSDLRFDKPIGLFRHEAIQNLDKKEYTEKRNELFDLYNLMINANLSDEEFSIDKHSDYRKMLRLLLEPSLKYMYKVIDESFYDKYLK